MVDLLRSEPAAFDEVCWELQGTSEVKGYVMVVPEALKMFLVFAKRRSNKLVARLALPTAVSATDGSSDSLGAEVATKVGSKGIVVAGGIEGGQRGDSSKVSRFCCCRLGNPSGSS